MPRVLTIAARDWMRWRDWRTILIPFHNGNQIEQIRLYRRSAGEQQDDGEEKGRKGTRFVVELDLARIGRFQLDGLVYEKEKSMEYDPVKDPNRFVFFVKDKSGIVSKVIFSGAKPTDIEKSEQIVMTGYMEGEEFRCNKIQMKCPSKYKNDQVAIGG